MSPFPSWIIGASNLDCRSIEHREGHRHGGDKLIALVWIARLLALAGFLDATYLTAVHLSGGEVACGPNGGCDIVLASRFATVGGVPLAAIGIVYYVVANLLAWTPAQRWSRGVAGAFASLTGAAFAASATLFWIQASVLHAWCRYCLASAGITTLLFACALALLRVAGRTPPPVPPAD